MATLKQCDACEDVWNPEDYQTYNGDDENRCSVSVLAPEESTRLYRKRYNKSYEMCQDCTRDVIKLIEGKKDKPA